MKHIFILLASVLITLNLSAQEDDFKTIFQRKSNKELSITGFGGPIMSFSLVDKSLIHMLGGGGGVMINNVFFGGYGVGLTTPVPYAGSGSNYLSFGHGGFWMGIVLAPSRPIHLSISSLAGWGSISEKDPDRPGIYYASKPVFVITPIVEIELNFSKFFKLGAGTSLNLVTGPGIDDTNYSFSDFAKPSLFLSFKFGWFNS